MASPILLDVDYREVQRLQTQFAATQKDVSKAASRALQKTSRKLRTMALRASSADLGIPQKILRRRIKHFTPRDGLGARLFFGMNAIPLGDLKPRKVKGGVQAGSEYRAGAFIGKGKVWKRVGDKSRPISQQYLKVEDDMRRVIHADVLPSFKQVFMGHFKRELQWLTRSQ